MENIIKQLKKIEPSEEYKTKSLSLILAHAQNPENKFSFNFLEVFKYSIAMGLTGILIVFSFSDAFVGLNARILSPILLSSLNEEKIQNEANQVDIKITVSEAKYYNDSINKVAVALDETAKNGPGHLNSMIIEKEMQGLDINNQNDEDINELLNKLTL